MVLISLTIVPYFPEPALAVVLFSSVFLQTVYFLFLFSPTCFFFIVDLYKSNQ